ncbi:DUF2635 domain-containing protein [Psychromonas aquimarina]|uniref:DUF2635 domain-containing protein n=1 Tax=Psychromonas aquimarina TaxID=444919 RepID=UPI00040420D9|nr:DUF2635 domain-containing protein [Psychromonas aquimarina]
MQTFKIKPNVKGKIVRDPITYEALKPAGEVKPRNSYWLRRISDGDVVELSTDKHKKEE